MKVYKYNQPAHTYNRRDVMAAAWGMYAAQVRRPHSNGGRGLDMRFNFNREILAEYRRIIKENADRLAIDQNKVRDRRKGEKWPLIDEPQGIYNNHLVKDYFAHRADVRQIDYYHICFYGRNHWARNERDQKILEILQRNFSRFKAARTA